jgi:hypothetical protein
VRGARRAPANGAVVREALLNTGVLALVFGRRDEAIARWTAIPDGDAAKPAARHYLEQLEKPAR